MNRLVCALHILLQESIPLFQLDAAELMINDFLQLLPELYGESSCTMNSHLLSHLCKFVKLWGPLWTHSAFGFENKNGHLKRLFCGNTDVSSQIVFRVDVCQMLQLLYAQLQTCESTKTMEFLGSHTAPRSNMIYIRKHMYFVGQTKKITLSTEQAAIVIGDTAQSFTRLYKGCGKRDSTICSFIDKDKSVQFGQIQIFIKASKLLLYTSSPVLKNHW